MLTINLNIYLLKIHYYVKSFNNKFGRFASKQTKFFAFIQPNINLNSQPNFCPVFLSKMILQDTVMYSNTLFAIIMTRFSALPTGATIAAL